MSTRQAIGAVTAALSDLVETAIRGILPLARVTNLQPAAALADSKTPSVNVYLYRVEPNAELRNAADPVRNAAGQLVRLPVAAWKLHYLLTCIGATPDLEPELLLGAVLTTLNAQPVVTRDLATRVDDALALETSNRRFAAGSGLAAQSELVKLTPLGLSLADLSQLFRALTTDEPYALSTAWEASVVLLSPSDPPRASLPVTRPPRLFVSSSGSPRLTSVANLEGENTPIVMRSTLLIRGERLRADNAQVRVGSLDIDLSSAQARSDRIELPLSPPNSSGQPVALPLAPGLLGVQVRQRVNVSEDPAAPDFRPGAISNVLAVVLRPEIVGPVLLTTDADGAPAFGVATTPAPDSRWECLLLLSELRSNAPRSFMLSRSTLDSACVFFPSGAVPAGEWLVRIQVNGAESPLELDATGFSGPKVTVS